MQTDALAWRKERNTLEAKNNVPKKTAFEVERFITIPPNGKKTISTSILSGLLNSQYMWPLMHCSVTLEF